MIRWFALLVWLTPCYGQYVPTAFGRILSPGWTFLQDGHLSACNVGQSSCTITALPTTANSVLVAYIIAGNNVTISSVTGGTGTWTTCSNCHNFQTGKGGIDAIYGIGITAGSTNLGSINLSAATSGISELCVLEILPPAGFTPSLDVSGNTGSSSCLSACPTVALTPTATDAVVQLIANAAVYSLASFNSYASEYITDPNEQGVALNVKTAPATTFAIQSDAVAGNQWTAVAGLAFKSTAGTFNVPPPVFSIVNYFSTYQSNSGGTLTTCSPTCSITVPSTGTGHLLFLQVADVGGHNMTSVSDGSNTWVTPSGASTCKLIDSAGNGIGCAYVLSSVSGVTSVTITMSANTTSAGFALYEIARTSGSFVLDAQNSTANASSSTPSGQALTLTGTNDVIFQEMTQQGGTSDPTLYPQPFNNKGTNTFAGGTEFEISYANTGILLNTINGAAPKYNGTSSVSAVSGVAFK